MSKNMNLTLSRLDYASVMAALSDYVDIVNSPMMTSCAISDDEIIRLSKIASRMFHNLSKYPKAQKPVIGA